MLHTNKIIIKLNYYITKLVLASSNQWIIKKLTPLALFANLPNLKTSYWIFLFFI